MKKLSRLGDTNTKGGKILKGAKTVFANGVPVGLHTSSITPHPGGGKHKTAKTTSGSPTVFVEGQPVLREGSGCTCGDPINKGSPNIFVP